MKLRRLFFSAALLWYSQYPLAHSTYKVSSYMGSVRTHLQVELRKVSSGSETPRRSDSAPSTPRSQPGSHLTSINDIAQIRNPQLFGILGWHLSNWRE